MDADTGHIPLKGNLEKSADAEHIRGDFKSRTLELESNIEKFWKEGVNNKMASEDMDYMTWNIDRNLPDLVLTAIDFKKIELKGDARKAKAVTVTLPPGTEAVDVGLLGMDISFGTSNEVEPNNFGRLIVAILPQPEAVSGRTYKFVLKAFLQDGSDTGNWRGSFTVQIKCFGRKPS